MNTQISTTTFDGSRRYSGVYQQQGRMLRDADWNELVDVVKARLTVALEDVVGSGVPATGGLFSTHGPQAGRAYVDGIEAELVVSSTPGGPANPDVYANQADFPAPPALPADYVLYLDVWERVVSGLEEASLLDPALHGADTCTRTQVLTQLKWCPPPAAAGGPPVCEDADHNPPCGNAAMGATKRASAGTSAADPCDPCADTIDVIASSGNYLFRLEVHSVDGPPNQPTKLVLKWSSENGAEQHPVGSVPADFSGAGYVYEQFDDVDERQLGVHLATGFSPSRGTLTPTLPTAAAGGAYVRRWDGVLALTFDGAGVASIDTSGSPTSPASTDAGIPLTLVGTLAGHGDLTLGDAIGLELQALQVTLDLAGKRFVAGDHWLAVVRDTITEPIIPEPQPYGVHHHYLTLGQTSGDGTFALGGSPREFAFPTLTDMAAGDIGYSNPGCTSGIFSSSTTVAQALDAVCDLNATQVSYSATANTTTASATNVQKALDLLSVLTATEIPYDPGTCPVLQGATNVEQALMLLCQNATQGNSFNFALIRLFGRGVICGVIPSITASAPAAGSTNVPIEITVTDGTIIDGNGAVTVVSGVAPLQTTVPALKLQGIILHPGPPTSLEIAITKALADRNLSGVVADTQVTPLAGLLAGKTFASTAELERAITGATGVTNPDVLSAVTAGVVTVGIPLEIVPVEVTQWLYIVTTPGQPPALQLIANAPTSLMTLPPDVSDAIRDPSAGPSIPSGADCPTATADAWAAYGDVPCVSTNGNTNVCLGTVGVFGQAGWVSPDDREQITPPSVAAAWWRSQRQSTYDAQKAACIAGSLTITSLNLGGPAGPALDNQVLLGGTSSRTLFVTLSAVVRGNAAVTVVFQSSPGVTVHGPLGIKPGRAGATVTFDIADGAGPQSITAQIDPSRQHASEFTSVQLEPPTIVGTQAVLPGDLATIQVGLTAAATEALTVSLTAPQLPAATLQIPSGSISGSVQLPIAASSSFPLQAGVMGASRTAEITVVSMATLNLQSGQNLNGAVLQFGAQPAVVTLSGPAPRDIEIAVSTNGIVQVAPAQVPVAAGSTTSQPFELIPASAGFGNQTALVLATFQLQQITATVTVQGFLIPGL